MRFIQTLVILLISVVGYSQNYQRLFATGNGTDVQVIDAMQDAAGSTYVVSRFVTEDLEDEGLYISKHNLKGDVDWENEIHLEGDYEITRYGDMEAIGKDSFLIAFQVRRDSVYSQALLRTGGMGQSEWSFNYYTNTDSTNTARPVELALRDTTRITLAGTRVDSTETMSLWTVDNEGTTSTLEINFAVSDTLDNVYSYNFSEIDYDPLDTTYVVSGKMLADSTQLFVARLDSTYSQVWARSYHLPDMESAQIYEQLLTDSGEIVIVGTARPAETRGFVAKLDTVGNVAWLTTINSSDLTSAGTVLTSASLGQNGEIVVGGSYLENFIFSRPFMLAFDQEGTRLWERQYVREPIIQYDVTSGISELQEHLTIIDQGNLMAAPDGGYVQVNSVQTFSSVELRQAININKTDAEGNSFRVEGETATCDSDIDLVSGMTTVEHDTLIFSGVGLFDVSNPITVIDTFLHVDMSAPILSLIADIQCPDSINVTLDATLLNGETYEWNTGAMTPMITVMDTEEYMVTVTFDTETCFQLCDTVQVPVYSPVEGFIDLQERERWCGQPREFVLEAFATGGSGDYFYTWDQGETDKSVVRNEATAAYTVTISDTCGQDTIVSRTIFDTEFELPDEADILVECADNAYILTVITSGATFDLSSIEWSNGETGVSSITVTDTDVYSVTLVDDCFYPISASTDLNNITEMNLVFDDGNYCSDGVVFISASFSPNNFFDVSNLTWSTGDSDDGQQSITVTEFGPYTAMITDNCGNMFTQTIEIPDLSQAPEVIMIDVTCTANGVIYTITNADVLDEQSIEWTDENGNIIALGETSVIVTSGETITVTAVDDCQNVVNTMEQVMQEPEEIVLGFDCNGDMFTYSIANSSQLDDSSIVWTDASGTVLGQGVISITVEMAQSITATAVDLCLNEVSATLDNAFEEVNLALDVDCGESSTTLTASATGSVDWDLSGYQWSTGEITPEIQVSEANVGQLISVQVIDLCGDTISNSITINQGNLWPCECVSWPNFMNLNVLAGVDNDPSFGPIINCGTLVTNYSLWIYNAYGNLIYTTSATAPRLEDAMDDESGLTKIGVNWNGLQNNNGDRMPSGVYKYYSTYTVDGEPMEQKGELTLVR